MTEGPVSGVWSVRTRQAGLAQAVLCLRPQAPLAPKEKPCAALEGMPGMPDSPGRGGSHHVASSDNLIYKAAEERGRNVQIQMLMPISHPEQATGNAVINPQSKPTNGAPIIPWRLPDHRIGKPPGEGFRLPGAGKVRDGDCQETH